MVLNAYGKILFLLRKNKLVGLYDTCVYSYSIAALEIKIFYVCRFKRETRSFIKY